MGLKQEYFDEKIPSEFICSHCHDVFLEPAVLSCSHMLCSKCHRKRMKRKTPTCPVCTHALCLSDGDVDSEWRKRYEGLKINCPKGCEKVLLLRNLNNHYFYHCPLTFTLCVNTGCSKNVRRKDFGLHLQQCDFRMVNCEGCGFRTKYINLRMHQIVQKCLLRTNLHMIVQNRREMNARVKEHRLKLQEESFEIELEERDMDRTKMWSAIARNDISRVVTPNPSAGKRLSDPTDKDNGLYRVARSAPVSPLARRSPIASPTTTKCKLCANCNKLFSDHRNHAQACSWHKGPVVDVFGGMCQACGKLDNLEGCMRGWHVSADQMEASRSRLFKSSSSTFLT